MRPYDAPDSFGNWDAYLYDRHNMHQEPPDCEHCVWWDDAKRCVLKRGVLDDYCEFTEVINHEQKS